MVVDDFDDYINIFSQVKQWKEEDSRGPLESTYEEEDQLSPVSVLDFSNEDEEIETPSSSSFEDSLANMESTSILLFNPSSITNDLM